MSPVPGTTKEATQIEIRAIALDVDGVLTDGAVWWGPNGEEWKRFSFADIMGVSLARKAGLVVALISGEDSPLVDRYAAKMGIVHVEKNCKDKASAIQRFSAQANIPLSQICFMGDDVNDLGAMQLAGLAAAPADARPAVLNKVSFVATKNGGNGAVRELVDFLLAQKTVKQTSKLESNLS
jgi:3-deoxy-D-manno-octulosonate 8-phosphate phosphatase (KDO 8-P phosphatase)